MAQGRSCCDLAVQGGIDDHNIASARHKRDRRYQEFLKTANIEVDGMLDVLTELSSRYRMAIVSTSKRADFDVIHATRDMRRFFEFLINVEDYSQVKPAPDPYLKALERFQAKPVEALTIEDSSRGLASAMAAGIDCAIVRSDFTASQDFRGAWRVLESARDLPLALTG